MTRVLALEYIYIYSDVFMLMGEKKTAVILENPSLKFWFWLSPLAHDMDCTG